MRVISGETEQKKITRGSNVDPLAPTHPTPPHSTPPPTSKHWFMLFILSGVVSSVPRNKCSFCSDPTSVQSGMINVSLTFADVPPVMFSSLSAFLPASLCLKALHLLLQMYKFVSDHCKPASWHRLHTARADATILGGISLWWAGRLCGFFS